MTFYRKNPYVFEISHFTEDWEIEDDSFSKTSLESDLVVYEKKEGEIIPRVVVEWKICSVAMQGAVAYR